MHLLFALLTLSFDVCHASLSFSISKYLPGSAIVPDKLNSYLHEEIQKNERLAGLLFVLPFSFFFSLFSFVFDRSKIYVNMSNNYPTNNQIFSFSKTCHTTPLYWTCCVTRYPNTTMSIWLNKCNCTKKSSKKKEKEKRKRKRTTGGMERR